MRSIAHLVLGKAIPMLCQALYFLYLAKVLGATEFGYFSFCLAISSILGVGIQFGLNSIVSREVSYGHEREILISALIVRVAISLATVSLCIIIKMVIASSRIDLVIVLLLAEILRSGNVFLHKLEGLSKTKAILVINSLIALPMFLVKIFIVYYFIEHPKIILIVAVLYVFEVGLLSLFYFLSSRNLTMQSPFFWSWNLIKKTLRLGAPLILSGLAAVVNMRVDQVFVGALLGDESVGIYSVVARLSDLWIFIPTMAATALMPRLVKLNCDRRHYDVDTTLENLYLLFIYIAFSLSILSFLGAIVVFLFLGGAYVNGIPVIAIYIIGSAFLGVRAFLSKHLLLKNLISLSFYSQISGALVNAFLNPILIPLCGLQGAAIATVFSYFVSSYLFFQVLPSGVVIRCTLNQAIITLFKKKPVQVYTDLKRSEVL
ncbi:flippase [Zooshikella ganghwensis]|uniref:Flippase n=1 Tax=Zooshikella ganghwensis TaxID=202772 RepID=A0A4P9VIT2_9GAMM|nr:flippase [Zooshikella ganghwensis]RDH43158.1 flippase [Zooshikella ganghwensis]